MIENIASFFRPLMDAENERLSSAITSKIALVLEMFTAVLIFIAIVAGIISLFPELNRIIYSSHVTFDITVFLEKASIIIVAIEFFKMLCHPTSENVLETIIFLVARHMIINQTTPIEDFVSVIGIILLVVAKRFLRVAKHKKSFLGEE